MIKPQIKVIRGKCNTGVTV
jgi:hypothetical protein